jgi:syntaxin 18
LNDTQRDEIDFQVKVVVKRCLESIKELERAEEARKKNAPTTPTALSPLNSLLALSTARDSSTSILASSLISAHRASITQYLSALLSKASSLQGDMQEARLRVQREKTRSLANSRLELQERAGADASQATAASTAPTVIRGSVGGSFDPQLDSETDLVGKDISAQLSASQIEMFENESSELIKSLESDLASIKKAESRLYEISELQTQVVQQLEQQGEVTDQLLDEAIGVGTEVGRGNEELRKARQRSREADKFLSIFLVGSGLALLFLHWMD